MAAQTHTPAEQAMLENEAQDWLILLTSGRVSTDDATRFKQWVATSPAHAQAFGTASAVWQALHPAVHEAINESSLQVARRKAWWRRLTAMPASPGRRMFIGGAVAGAAAYVAIRPPFQLWPSVNDLTADYRTATGEQRRLKIGEAMVVDMNTQTSLNVRSSAAGGTTVELLDGEAEIAALGAAAQPVTVLARGGRIMAADARFNVRDTGTDVCVTCLQGEVKLQHPRGATVIRAAQQIRYDAHGVQSPMNADLDAVTAWRHGWLVFANTPLAAVINEINRYRPGRIVLINTQLGQSLVQARFAFAQLANAEVLIRDAYGAKLTRLPGGVVLLS